MKTAIKLLLSLSLLFTGAFTAFSQEAETIDDGFVPATGYDWKPGVSNAPVGKARGIFPGRVVLTRDADATKWAGNWQEDSDQWWLDENTDIDKVENLISVAIKKLTGVKKSDKRAWKKIFKYFNKTHGYKVRGYRKGEVIAIKVNINNSNDRRKKGNSNLSDTSPQAILAMVRQLVKKAHVPQEDIFIYDVRRPFPGQYLQEIWKEFPNVRFVQDGKPRDFQPVNPAYGDHTGILAADWVEGVEYSIPGFNEAKLIDSRVRDCKYIVNLAMLKLHSYPYNYMEDGDEGQTAVTMTSKNHAGSIKGTPELHYWLNTRQGATPMAYSPLVDLENCPNLGGKTLIYMMDGLYCGRKHRTYPLHFPNPPFNNCAEPYANNQWPACIIASLDGVAIQSVGLDIFYAQSLNNEEPSYHNVPRILVRDNADDFLKEEATPYDAPSGTKYVSAEGKPLESLGVFEHWDNPESMKYSRNLDPKNGQGIEFLYYDLTKSK